MALLDEAIAMLREIEAADRGAEPFQLPQRDDPRRVRTLDDLFAERLVRADGEPLKDGAGSYVAVRGLRPTDSGRRELDRAQAEVVGVSVEERQRLEAVIGIVKRADALGELEKLGDLGRELAAQAETIRIQLYMAPEPDRTIVRRALSLLWKSTQAVSTIAGLIALTDLPKAVQTITTLLD